MRAVAVDLREDETYPQGGVAALRLCDPGLAAAGSDRAPVEVIIRRNDEQEPFLGPAGWQVSEFRWQSGAVRGDAAGLIVPLGPLVCGQVEDYTPLEFQLPGLGIAGTAVWSEISPPPTGTGGAPSRLGPLAGSSFGAAEPPPEPTYEPAPEPKPEPPPIPKLEPGPPPTPKLEPIPEPDPVMRDVGASVPPVPPHIRMPQPPQEPAAAPRKTMKLVLLSLGYVLLLALVIGGVIAVLWDEKDAPASQPVARQEEEMPFPAEEQAPEAEAVAQAPAEPEAAVEPEQPSGATTVPTRSAAERHADAVEAAQEGRRNDAVRGFQSLRMEGYGPTLLYLARAYDSVDFVPTVSMAPDDGEALSLYAAACEAGETGVAEDLAALRAVLQAKADQGDQIARMTLQFGYSDAEAACAPQ